MADGWDIAQPPSLARLGEGAATASTGGPGPVIDPATIQAPYRGTILPFSVDGDGRARFDGTAGLLGGAMAPGDAATGRLDPNSEEGHRRIDELAGLAMLGSLPAASRAPTIAELGRGLEANPLASKFWNMYNPASKSPRPFEADYPLEKWPNGPPVDAAGRLTKTIDGADINPGASIAGRNIAGDPDVAISPSRYDALAAAGTGGRAPLHEARILGGGVGAVELWPGTRDPKQVWYKSSLTENRGLEVNPLASKFWNMYNPPAKPPRPFEADYPLEKWPNGPPIDAAGRLTRDIEGRELSARHVVGRRAGGDADVAFPASEYDALATQGTGGRTPIYQAKIPGGGDGAVTLRPGTRDPERVWYKRSLTDTQLPMIRGHEVGHVIDLVAKGIPQKGLSEELKAVYNSLNNGNRDRLTGDAAGWGKPTTPTEPKGRYTADEAPAEYMAEAIRAYMTDPNYMKTVAPRTAAAIRKAVNENPLLNRHIQFNSGGSPLPAAAIGASPPPSQPAGPQDGAVAIDPATGRAVIFKGGQWVPGA